MHELQGMVTDLVSYTYGGHVEVTTLPILVAEIEVGIGVGVEVGLGRYVGHGGWTVIVGCAVVV